MNEEKKTEIKVGITIFIALIIFVLIFGWAKNYSLTSHDMKLSVKFNSVAGLEVGDLVTVNGVRKGYVESIESEPNSALVKINFSEDPNLKDDASFSIMMLDLMGGKKIEIINGISQNNLDYGKTYIGKFSGDISTVMATLNSVEGDLISVIKDLKSTLDFVNINFSNEEFKTNITQSVSNLQKLSANLNELLVKNQKDISEIIANTKNITNDTKNLLNDNKAEFNDIIKISKKTLVSTDSLIQKLNLITDETVKGKNNIGKLLYDENLIGDIKESMEQLKKLTKTINDQLENGGLEVKADVDLF
ncbi:MAG: MCE family protein [Ignavibacteriales bacterium]|nr:MCE family protein [Ignavibacteriales bacterium]